MRCPCSEFPTLRLHPPPQKSTLIYYKETIHTFVYQSIPALVLTSPDNFSQASDEIPLLCVFLMHLIWLKFDAALSSSVYILTSSTRTTSMPGFSRVLSPGSIDWWLHFTSIFSYVFTRNESILGVFFGFVDNAPVSHRFNRLFYFWMLILEISILKQLGSDQGYIFLLGFRGSLSALR